MFEKSVLSRNLFKDCGFFYVVYKAKTFRKFLKFPKRYQFSRRLKSRAYNFSPTISLP